MEEIEFRGRTAKCEWVYGYYLNRTNDKEAIHCIMEKFPATVGKRVIPETVGQYTGKKDRNGKKVYEGDILYIRCGHGIECVIGKAIVYFSETLLQFRVKAIQPYAYDSEVGDLYKDCDFTHIDEYEVIGNIFDKENGDGRKENN